MLFINCFISRPPIYSSTCQQVRCCECFDMDAGDIEVTVITTHGSGPTLCNNIAQRTKHTLQQQQNIHTCDHKHQHHVFFDEETHNTTPTYMQ